MNITAKQIAEMLHISKQAVYSVLSNKPKCLVSQEKKEKILFLAKAYHYKQNMAALSLKGKSTFQIGAVIDSFGGIEGRILSRLASKLELENYSLCAAKITSIPQGLDRIQNFISAGADAVIFSGSRLGEIRREDFSVPLLSLNGEFGTNYRAGARSAAEHLIREHGHRNILHVASEAGLSPKYQGYCDAMEAAGLKPLPVLSTILNPKFGDQVKKYLDRGVTAFLTAGDDTASLLIFFLNSLGVRVPEDAAVTGFDRFGCFPQIASVEDPVDKIAALGCRIVLRKIREKIMDPLAPQLIEPEFHPSCSCGCEAPRLESIANFYSETDLVSTETNAEGRKKRNETE
jgi:DNA-binding LacI/PurR family transcriptional regulator